MDRSAISPQARTPGRTALRRPGGRLRQAFDRLDTDGNGSPSKNEYAASPMADRADPGVLGAGVA